MLCKFITLCIYLTSNTLPYRFPNLDVLHHTPHCHIHMDAVHAFFMILEALNGLIEVVDHERVIRKSVPVDGDVYL